MGMEILTYGFVIFVIAFMNWIFSWKIPSWIIWILIFISILLIIGYIIGIGFKFAVGGLVG